MFTFGANRPVHEPLESVHTRTISVSIQFYSDRHLDRAKRTPHRRNL